MILMNTLILKAKNFARKLAFDSGWDVLKAGLIALVTFGIGNVTGWWKSEPRTIRAEQNILGDYILGYTLFTTAFDEYENDYGDAVTLRFTPPELRMTGYCTTVIFKGYKEALFDQIVQKTAGCLEVDQRISGPVKVVTFSPGPQLDFVEKEGQKAYFCGCEQSVLDHYLNDPGTL